MAKEKRKNKISKYSENPVFINPKTDFGFKKIFGHKTIFISFLNTILSEKIVDIEYLPGEHFGYKKENRKAAYDISCKTADGKHVIVEMQAAPQPHFAERELFYASYPIISQAPKGKITKTNRKDKEIKAPWDYSLAGVYMIGILDFILFPEEKAKNIVIEHVKLVRQEANIIFSDKLELVTIELPKFDKDETELATVQEKWLYSLQNMEKLQKRPENMTEIFKELYKIARIDNLTEEEMEKYQKSVLEYDDVILAVDYAEERGEMRGFEIGEKRGFETGEKQGIEIERNRLVRSFYTHNMSVEEIAKLMNLTVKQISDILKIKADTKS
jgi:predicted transposase/invertase (TIGR01784 family)